MSDQVPRPSLAPGDIWSPWPVFSKNLVSLISQNSPFPWCNFSNYFLVISVHWFPSCSLPKLYLELRPISLPPLQNSVIVVPISKMFLNRVDSSIFNINQRQERGRARPTGRASLLLWKKHGTSERLETEERRKMFTLSGWLYYARP